MKLKDLITALADEIETVRPELDQRLDNLSTLGLDDPTFFDELDAYSTQTQLMGEAAGYAGFEGLEAVSEHILNNMMLLSTQEVEERQTLVDFLRMWPDLMSHYLHNLDDHSVAQGLVDMLKVAPYPIDDAEGERLLQQFDSLPGIIEADEEQEKQQRQSLATPEDVTLIVPEDADQRLMDGFFQESPGQAAYVLELVRSLTTEEGDISDIVAAKRSVHTLKGASSIIGLRGITNLGHHFEDILEYFEVTKGKVSPAVAETLLDGAYCLEQMVGYVCGTDDYPKQSQKVLQSILDLAHTIDAGDVDNYSPSPQTGAITEQDDALTAPEEKTQHFENQENIPLDKNDDIESVDINEPVDNFVDKADAEPQKEPQVDDELQIDNEPQTAQEYLASSNAGTEIDSLSYWIAEDKQDAVPERDVFADLADFSIHTEHDSDVAEETVEQPNEQVSEQIGETTQTVDQAGDDSIATADTIATQDLEDDLIDFDDNFTAFDDDLTDFDDGLDVASGVSQGMANVLIDEVEIVRPELRELLEKVSDMDGEDPEFIDTLSAYSNQVKNMGDAAGEIGFVGLQAVTNHVLENVMLMATQKKNEREDLVFFLHSYPDWVVDYLQDLQDTSVVNGLIDVLRVAPRPIDDVQAMQLTDLFATTQASLVDDDADELLTAAEAEVEKRPATVSEEDVALDIPADVNAKLLEGFLQEAPQQAGYLLQLIRDTSSADGNISDIVAAKRSAHSLKGSAATIGLNGIANMGHHFEDILEYFEHHEGKVSPVVVDMLIDGAYCLEQMVGYVSGTDDYPEQSKQVLQNILDLANLVDKGAVPGLAETTAAAEAAEAATQIDAETTATEAKEEELAEAAKLAEAEAAKVAEAEAAKAAEAEAAKAAEAEAAKAAEAEAAKAAEAEATKAAEAEAAKAAEAEAARTAEAEAAAMATAAKAPVRQVQAATPTAFSAPVAAKPKAAQTKPQPPAKAAPQHHAAVQPQAALRVSMERIEELFRVSAEVTVHSGAMETKIKQLRDDSRTLLEQNIRLKQRLFELETMVDVRAVPLMRAGSSGGRADFDPLEMDEYNELHSTVHALVEELNDSMMHGHSIEEEIAQLTGMQNRQQVLAADLQHLVTGTRMAEVGTLESRLQRNVRTTAQTTGKSAVLVLHGENTLIDTDVLSRLAEPLLHLLRNAVDHGIETPGIREQLGKPQQGTITLDFSRQGQQVVLRCSDDGKGLNPIYILQRAKKRGLVGEDDVLSDEDIIRLILIPGFSTRDEVSEVSGRGVGMDVVSEWVQNMNGRIDVQSEPGKGTTIELRFAASLTTSHSLITMIAGHYFALPSVQIAQSVSRGDGEFTLINDELQYRLEDDLMQARFLADMVGLPRQENKSLQDFDVVIVNVLNQRYALAVDELIDSRELLVKTQSRYLQHVNGMAGTSILGDGGIAIHLDIAQLISGKTTAVQASQSKTAAAQPAANRLPRVLIVDDSLSVRNTLQELVADLGMQVQTARDGLDAIETIDSFVPDLVLTDLEMPNINGVELTGHIRGREDIGNVPIIMITSRSLNKHRELATRAGVNAYVTKPYNDGDLVKLINDTLKG